MKSLRLMIRLSAVILAFFLSNAAQALETDPTTGLYPPSAFEETVPVELGPKNFYCYVFEPLKVRIKELQSLIGFIPDTQLETQVPVFCEFAAEEILNQTRSRDHMVSATIKYSRRMYTIQDQLRESLSGYGFSQPRCHIRMLTEVTVEFPELTFAGKPFSVTHRDQKKVLHYPGRCNPSDNQARLDGQLAELDYGRWDLW